MTLPDFLCIGAMKSGTTWLYNNLRYHPNLWLPPVKELHYFDWSSSPNIRMSFGSNPAKRYFMLSQFRALAREIILDLKNLQLPLDTIDWFVRFSFYTHDDRWYNALFVPKPGQIAGEITPTYALLPEEKVIQIYRLMPELKIIYLLRNPVDRAWSQIRMYLSRFKNLSLDQVKYETIKQHFDRLKSIPYSSYTSTLSVWEKHFVSEQIFIGFFEQIVHSPRDLLFDIYRFLNVPESEVYISPYLQKKVFANKGSLPMPKELRREITARLYPEIRALHERFNNQYTESWLVSAQDTLTD
ncbi:sulfotransferase domain-containing protein [Oscillatoria salina]|uniref:sulfotransferase domain-containing protein n=1 Tax=Oscillatoria salina TaxID=331517 RepID=UPI0013BE7C6B|nr:sulfotransferase domain-containing protein [Oscillatoria salina]MBZ8181785.1 sulfotransferase [Oscillatoria salina IIICB1]NET89480.1 sulfotransferase [Kamptonema sp. SIO1D9]